ncbi:MAG: TldD/PmbA family protein [Nanoarchaeota archaeon]|nr:TldD/PmbA family protein [Nanoarchaeota archaeon]
MIEKIEKFLKKQIDEYEIYYKEHSSLNADIQNNKINFISDGVSHGLSIRVFTNKRLGFAYTSDLNQYQKCIETAIKIAKMNKIDKDFKGFVKKANYRHIKNYNEKVSQITPHFINKFTTRLVKNISDINKNIKIAGGIFSKTITNLNIRNSNGINYVDKTADNSFMASLVLKNKDHFENIGIAKSSRLPLSQDIGKCEAKRLLNLLNKKSLKNGQMQLALHPDALGDLFNQSYVFSINAANVQSKKSLWHNKIENKVFDKNLTIIDDGISENLLCSRSFDDEGTPSQKFKVIENGILKNILYDNQHAQKDNTKSTSNAQRDVQSLPSILPNNIIIKSGASKDIINEIDKGIYIRNLLGVHTMNEATGDFSLGITEGFYIENGEIKHPIKGTMIAGNFFKIMNNVEALTKEKKHSLSVSGGCYFPEILFKKIKIIGNSA